MDKHQQKMISGEEGDFTFVDSKENEHKAFSHLLMFNSPYFYGFLTGSFKKDTYKVDSITAIKPLLYSLQAKERLNLRFVKEKGVFQFMYDKVTFVLSLEEMIIYLDYCKQWMVDDNIRTMDMFMATNFRELPLHFLVKVYPFIEAEYAAVKIWQKLYQEIKGKKSDTIMLSDLWCDNQNSIFRDYLLHIRRNKRDRKIQNRLELILTRLSEEFVAKKELIKKEKDQKKLKIHFSKIVISILSNLRNFNLSKINIFSLELIRALFTKEQIYYLKNCVLGIYSQMTSVYVNDELIDEKIELIYTKYAGEILDVYTSYTTMWFSPSIPLKTGQIMIDEMNQQYTIKSIKDTDQVETTKMFPGFLYCVEISDDDHLEEDFKGGNKLYLSKRISALTC